jgi:hypothetical protein
MQLDFKHKPAGHCENGVVSNLLGFYGINISEAMVFGLGSGLFFAHMPFIKLHGMAVTSFRPLPGAIFSRVMYLLGIKMKRYKFRDKEKSMTAFSVFMVIGRLISGVHWFTDIVGGVLLSAGLFTVYKAVVMLTIKK